MIRVSLVDSLFSHTHTACNGDLDIQPQKIRFDRSSKQHSARVFTDKDLGKSAYDATPVKVAWLLESPDLFDSLYKEITQPHALKFFDVVATHNRRLLQAGGKFVFCPFGGTWIPPEKWRLYPKRKTVSIVASAKRDLEGHRLRHEIIERFGDRITQVMGGGYAPFADKIDSLKEFRYSIVVENCKEDYWFTEKLIDCFACGTVPIYWGCPSISRFFNPNGIIVFDSTEELNTILRSLSPEDYGNRRDAIEDNFNRAKAYMITEDYLASNVIEPLLAGKDANT